MIPEWTTMVDAQAQIRQALTGLETEVAYQVLCRWPRTDDTGNLITVTELTNSQTETPVVDTLGYQLDIWTAEQDDVDELAPLVNAAMCGIGLRREYASPVEYQSDRYRKTLRYGRKVDKRTMRLID